VTLLPAIRGLPVADSSSAAKVELATFELRQRLASREFDFFVLRVPCALVTVGFSGAISALFRYRTSGSAAQAVTRRPNPITPMKRMTWLRRTSQPMRHFAFTPAPLDSGIVRDDETFECGKEFLCNFHEFSLFVDALNSDEFIVIFSV
jgi:hypothetical protein